MALQLLFELEASSYFYLEDKMLQSDLVRDVVGGSASDLTRDSAFGLIQVDLNQFRYSKAMMGLSTLSKTYNKDLVFLRLLAQTQKSLGDFMGLIKTLQVTAQITQATSDYIELMQILSLQGRLNEALDIALMLQEKTLSPHEDRQLAHCLVKIYLEFGDFEGIQEVLGACDYVAEDGLLLWAMGLVFLNLGDKYEAFNFFKKAVLIDHTNEQAWISLSQLHEEGGNDSLAKASLEKVFDLNSNNMAAFGMASNSAFSMALKFMVHLILKCPRRDVEEINKVLEQLRKYLSQFEFDAEISLCYTQLLVEIKDMASARLEIEKLILYDPTNDSYLKMKKNFEAGMKIF